MSWDLPVTTWVVFTALAGLSILTLTVVIFRLETSPSTSRTGVWRTTQILQASVRTAFSSSSRLW